MVKEIYLIMMRGHCVYATEDMNYALEKMKKYKADYFISTLLFEKSDIKKIKRMRKHGRHVKKSK